MQQLSPDLAIATGVAALPGIGGRLVVLGGIGWAVFSLARWTAPPVAYTGVGGPALLALMLTVAGVANAFFWTYWTLADLRLSGGGGAEIAQAAA